MADPNQKWYDNIEESVEFDGKKVSFYCDSECIFCSVCHEVAPTNFKMGEDEDHDICFKQPSNEQELKDCYEALQSCPVNAIGDDGHLGKGDGYNRERLTEWSDVADKRYDSDKEKETKQEQDELLDNLLGDWDDLE